MSWIGNFTTFIKVFLFNKGEWIKGSWESVVIFSPITPNVHFVATFFSLKSQKHKAWNKLKQYIHRSVVHLCMILQYVKISYIIFWWMLIQIKYVIHHWNEQFLFLCLQTFGGHCMPLYSDIRSEAFTLYC